MMQINRGPRAHRYGRLRNRLHEIHPRYLSLDDIDEFPVPSQEFSEINLDSFPYPVLEVTDGYQLHLYPAYDHLRPMLVRTYDGEVLTDGHEPYGFWLTPEGISKARQAIIEQAENYTKQSAPQELGPAMQEALASDDLLHDYFSPQLTAKLRPPTIRWLRQRTQSVTADTVEYTGGAYIKTQWLIDLGPESERAPQSTRTLKFHSDEIFQQDSQRLTVDYRSLFHQNIYCSNSWWFDLSSSWITSASVDDIVEDDYPAVNPEDLSLRQSGKGKYHLVRDDAGRTICGYDARSTNTRAFSPESLPVPPMLCNHCSRSVKRHLIPT